MTDFDSFRDERIRKELAEKSEVNFAEYVEAILDWRRVEHGLPSWKR